MRRALVVALSLIAAAVPAAQQASSGVVQRQDPSSHSTITGRIVDEYGDPVVAAMVTAEAVPAAAGAPSRTLAFGSTDDRGEYSIEHVPPGACVLAVMRPRSLMTLPDGHAIEMSFGPRREPLKIYYPSAASPADADRITIAADEEKDDVDFVVPAAPLSLPPVAAIRIAQSGPPTPPTGATASISGRVTTTDGRAIAHAQVQVVAEPDVLQSRTGSTDADGRYEFRDLAPGRFHVYAAKTGFAAIVDPSATAAAKSERAVEVRAGGVSDRIDLTLRRWSIVSGTVVDENGAAMPSASVQLLEIRYSAGRRRLVPAAGSGKVTDRRGRYRIWAVAPGRYAVSASVGGVFTADVANYARSYYPGTIDAANAQFIAVGAAQEIGGIDVSMTRTRTARITGQVRNAAGQPANPGSLTLVPSAHSTSLVSAGAGARLKDDGSFEFPNVPPGAYIIRADRGRTNGWTEGESGVLPVSVNGTDVTDLTLQTSTGSTITGRIRFDTYRDTKPPAASAIELSPQPIDYDQSPANVATANVHADWTFELHGVSGPRRLQLIRPVDGWALMEIGARGADVTDRAIAFGRGDQSIADVEVVLTDRIAELAGTVADDQGHAAPRAQVIVFSTDRDRWYAASRFLRHASADADGAFSIGGLPAGSYHIVALARLPLTGDDWQDPAFLESLIPRAERVSIGDAQKQVVRLKADATY